MKALAQAEQAQLQQKALATAAKPSPPKTPTQGSHKKQQRLESDMQTLEQEKEQLTQAMSLTTASTELAKLGRQLKNTEDQLSQLEAQWLELLETSEKA
jgi:hypothetical protein